MSNMWVLIIGLYTFVGAFIAVKTKFVYFKDMTKIGKYLSKEENGDISPMQALTTSLAASLGTGNILGVSSAIAVGGPGSIFWMWITALIGSGLQYVEGFLGVLFREKKGYEYLGGPMQYLSKGFKNDYKIGLIYAIICLFACLSMGNMMQANAIVSGMSFILVPNEIKSIFLVFIVFLVVCKGIKSIGTFTEKLIPIILALYLVVALIILVVFYENIGEAFTQIFTQAFKGSAVAGGLVGEVVKVGFARGIYTHEAGMGTSSIAHSVSANSPHREGVIASISVYIDTLIMCTITALVILVTGESDASAAFASIGIIGLATVDISLIFFGFATVIGWYYYGMKCFEFICKGRYIKVYTAIYMIGVYLGGILMQDILWEMSDAFNMLLLIINLTSLLFLVTFVKTKQ